MTDPAQGDERRGERRGGARPGPALGGMSGVHLRVAILPATAVTVLGAATVAFVLVGGRSEMATRIVLVAAAALAALVLIAAVTSAASATRRLQLQVAELRRASSRAHDELALVTERAQRGEQPALFVPPGLEQADPFEPAADSDGFVELAGDLERERYAAQQAVVQAVAQAAGRSSAGGRAAAEGPDQRVEVFVDLARRMQFLVHQQILLLDDLEAQVQDPAVLKDLFTVDHLATRMRRQSESLAVLGGAVTRRQWSRAVAVHEVLRAAVAEVEQYARVKVVPPVQGALAGSAVTDVIHLVAELIENATTFSAPHTQPVVRAQMATAGLVVEVEDRGLGMRPADQQRLNALLADPSRVSTVDLLRDGRIGLFVVATLARRHGIRVELQTNIYGGVQAVIVLPRTMIEETSPGLDEATPPEPDEATPPGSGETEPRPELPRRVSQTHLAPELRKARAPRRDGSADNQLPGLMAAFQQGISRAAEEDRPAETDSPR